MAIESVMNETHFPPFLEDKGVLIGTGNGAPEGKFGAIAYISERYTLNSTKQRDTIFLCIQNCLLPKRAYNNLKMFLVCTKTDSLLTIPSKSPFCPDPV